MKNNILDRFLAFIDRNDLKEAGFTSVERFRSKQTDADVLCFDANADPRFNRISTRTERSKLELEFPDEFRGQNQFDRPGLACFEIAKAEVTQCLIGQRV